MSADVSFNCPYSECFASLTWKINVGQKGILESFCPECYRPIQYNLDNNQITIRTPTKWYNAFFSHSFTDEDRKINKFFDSLLRSWGINLQLLEYNVNPGLWPDKVNTMIKASDFVFAVMTKRYEIEQKGTKFWKGSETIQDEIMLAYSNNKPVLLLVEKGVNVSGILPQVVFYYTFERNELKPPIIEPEFIEALKAHQNKVDQTRTRQGIFGILAVIGLVALLSGTEE